MSTGSIGGTGLAIPGASWVGSSNATAIQPAPQVESQLTQLKMSLEQLEKVQYTLGERLGAVLRPIPPTATDNQKGHPQECLVDLAERVRMLTQAVVTQTGYLQSVLERLEL
jgi:hypothetical protein